MKKIILIGSGGAGKSTLARQLGESLNIEVFHLDKLFWKLGWVGVPKEEQRKIQQELVQKDSWIIDGNYGGTMDIRLNAADTIIFLDMPRILCVYRIMKRRIKYWNTQRPDMGAGKERIQREFLKWVWNYRKEKRPLIIKTLEMMSEEKRIVILKSKKEVRQFLNNLQEY